MTTAAKRKQRKASARKVTVLRIPATLHAALKRHARTHRVSVNAVIVRACGAFVGHE
jgi:predicted HicB family RNase H-like nuclease